MTSDGDRTLSPPDTVLRRLVFVRYLFRIASEQSRRSDPLAAAAVLTLHDAIELLFQLSSEYLDVGKPHIDFMSYFTLIDAALEEQTVPEREATRRLNKARVALKHHGTSPSRLDLASFFESSSRLLRWVSTTVFGVSLDSLSLAWLVAHEPSRACLEEADRALVKSNLDAAIDSITEAFSRLMASRGLRGWDTGGSSRWLGTPGDHGYHIKRLSEAVQQLRWEMALVRNGVDTRRLAIFRSLTPNVAVTISGKAHVRRPHGLEVTEDSVRFCYDFVVDCALQLQDLDAELNHFSLRRQLVDGW